MLRIPNKQKESRMSSNENSVRIRKFTNPLKVAKANLHRCESLYKDAIKSGIGIAQAQVNYLQARYNYNLLKG